MTLIGPLWSFVALLAVHWLADFVCQSRWMATNKSKRSDALALHVGVYSAILLMASGVLFANFGIWRVFEFTALNGLLHFGTDSSPAGSLLDFGPSSAGMISSS